MSLQNKKDLARRLMHAKGEWSLWDRLAKSEEQSERMAERVRDAFLEMHRQANERARELLAELHAEFLSEDELEAELEFWGSDTGQRIIAKRKRMMKEFSRRVNSGALDTSEGTGLLAEYTGNLPPSDDS